ncbi:MAG TPA: P-loop NTPase [Thermoanaerobaculia bacterium]|nr:P-loop NTPase [Thermoanaerobaculia bacterium]
MGKSTVTLGLARALLAAGRRVAVLDCDLNGPSQAQMAGVLGLPWVPGEEGLELPRGSDGLAVLSLGSVLGSESALRFAAVSQGDEQVWRGTRELTVLGQLLAGVRWGELDVLLLDLPPGAERTVQVAQLLGPRASFLLVTIPSVVARQVVARSLDALAGESAIAGGAGRVVGYVENMAGYWCRECGAVRPLFPAAAAPLPVPLLASIPFDPELAAACDRGAPAALDSPAGEALRAAAGRLLATLEGSP